eukprot:scaffold28238_cov59-Phaeocystis_antarctica.AAC.5
MVRVRVRVSTAVPVGVEPVKAIFAMPLLCASAAPASDPYPVTTLSTPAGTVSLMSSMSAMIEVGVCSAGLSTTLPRENSHVEARAPSVVSMARQLPSSAVLCGAKGLTPLVAHQFPAARAGATFHAAMTSGKFHGMIWPTTPSGSWHGCSVSVRPLASLSLSVYARPGLASVSARSPTRACQGRSPNPHPTLSWMLIETVLMSISEAAPSSARITPAKYRKWSMTRGRSAAIDSRTALPLSTVSILASRSAFASMMSAILSNTFERSVTDALDQVDL